MVGRKPKRYTIWNTDGGYEVRDADDAGRRVYFSESHRIARDMAKHMNKGHESFEEPPEILPYGSGTGG